MEGLQLYDQLLELPLFQGLSRDDLTQIIARTRFDFLKYGKGKTVVKENEPCNRLCFLLNGTLEAETFSDDHSYRLLEELTAPEVLQPERIFGLHQHFTKTYYSKTETNFMILSKKEVMKLSDEFGIFRLNLFNIVCAQTQRLSRRPWQRNPGNLELRIIRFFESHCERPAGEKIIYIRMTDLAKELNESRLEISRALNQMQARRLLRLSRGRITLPALEKLLKDKANHDLQRG